MILIEPDYERRITIPGVPNPVRRPVDIDQSLTKFARLRTLRIYQFELGSVIEGHAEEDEVFLVVLAGSVELTMTTNSAEEGTPVKLTAPDGTDAVACAAYLPPKAAYSLVALSGADVAYARATPIDGRAPGVFLATACEDGVGIHLRLEEKTYGQLLSLRLVSFSSRETELSFTLLEDCETDSEGLVHIRLESPGEIMATITGSEGATVRVRSGDTVAASSGEGLTLNLPANLNGLALIVTAG